MSLTDELRTEYAPGVPYRTDSGDRRLIDLLFDSAKLYPKRVALDFLAQQTSYEDLVQQVFKAATVLSEAGVKPGDRVALVMPNCPQHIVALFATTLIGGIVVEHNPLAPAEELRHEFERHGANVVVAWEKAITNMDFLDASKRVYGVNLAHDLSATSRALLKIPLKSIRERKNQLGAKVPKTVVSWNKTVSNAKPWNGTCPSTADQIALLIHTGGTTGVPKAVALTHKNLCSNVYQSVAWVPPLHEGAEVFYSVLPYFHAFGLTISLLAGLRLAATIAVFPKFDPSQILLSQRRLPCTFFLGVPPMFDRLLAELENIPVDMTSMTFSLSGAMPLSQELMERWEQATGGLMIEGYGMSEASPILLGSPVSPLKRAGALGVPFPSTEVRIVDPENTEVDVPAGEIGELLARGPQVFGGYWENSEETAEVLKDGWLHTGDLVQIRDGFIYMADRRKELIISGGFNIYPSQVEDAVRSMPGIEDVAVVGMPSGKNSGEDVVAALVLEAGASISLADVREWAEKSLAHYALPRQIVVVQELPKSQIGKVMRRRVQRQISDIQDGMKVGLAAVAEQVSDLAERAGQATTAAKESLASAAAATSDIASGLGSKATEFIKQASAGTDDSDLIEEHESEVTSEQREETTEIEHSTDAD